MDSNLVSQGCPSDGNEPIDGTALGRSIDCHDDLRRVLSAGSRPNCTGGFGLKGVSRHPQHLSTF